MNEHPGVSSARHGPTAGRFAHGRLVALCAGAARHAAPETVVYLRGFARGCAEDADSPALEETSRPLGLGQEALSQPRELLQGAA